MTQPAAAMEGTLARVSDHCIAVSEQVPDDFTGGYGAANERISVVYNGIDTDLFSPSPPADAPHKLGLDPTLRYVLYVGPFFGFPWTHPAGQPAAPSADRVVKPVWLPGG